MKSPYFLPFSSTDPTSTIAVCHASLVKVQIQVVTVMDDGPRPLFGGEIQLMWFLTIFTQQMFTSRPDQPLSPSSSKFLNKYSRKALASR